MNEHGINQKLKIFKNRQYLLQKKTFSLSICYLFIILFRLADAVYRIHQNMSCMNVLLRIKNIN